MNELLEWVGATYSQVYYVLKAGIAAAWNHTKEGGKHDKRLLCLFIQAAHAFEEEEKLCKWKISKKWDD